MPTKKSTPGKSRKRPKKTVRVNAPSSKLLTGERGRAVGRVRKSLMPFVFDTNNLADFALMRPYLSKLAFAPPYP